jgi:hypothetical protein
LGYFGFFLEFKVLFLVILGIFFGYFAIFWY